MKFYAYLWLREDGTPYYAGKGCENRAFVQENHYCPLPKSRDRVLIFARASETEAFETEAELIRNWGRKDLGTGVLRNLTDGGDGSSGYKHTEEALQKMSAVHAGKHHSPATEFKVGHPSPRRGKAGYKATEEHRRKMSIAQRGHRNYSTAAGIEKMRQAKIGSKASAETRQRMSASGKKAWLKCKAQGEGQL
jgi:NUMOD3 motif